MKTKKIIPICILIILLFTSVYFFQNKTTMQSKTYYYLGTVNEITIFDKNKSASKKLLNNCDSILKDIDNKMSTHIPGSDVFNINKNAGSKFIKVSNDTFSVIKTAIKYSEISKNNFDITIGPLVNLWAIGTDNAKVPSKFEIEDKLNLVDFNKITLDEKNSSVKLNLSNMKIDLGGIAKGYAADKICSYLLKNDVHSALINLGGNVYALGNKLDNTDFTVGIQNPTIPNGNSIGNIKVSNKSVVTSGIYERYIEKDGHIYHHMLSPFTGYPFKNELSSVTIISNKSMICDALSTSVFGLGLKEGSKLIESLNNVEAIFITKDKHVHVTSGLKNKFNLTNNNFNLIN